MDTHLLNYIETSTFTGKLFFLLVVLFRLKSRATYFSYCFNNGTENPKTADVLKKRYIFERVIVKMFIASVHPSNMIINRGSPRLIIIFEG